MVNAATVPVRRTQILVPAIDFLKQFILPGKRSHRIVDPIRHERVEEGWKSFHGAKIQNRPVRLHDWSNRRKTSPAKNLAHNTNADKEYGHDPSFSRRKAGQCKVQLASRHHQNGKDHHVTESTREPEEWKRPVQIQIGDKRDVTPKHQKDTDQQQRYFRERFFPVTDHSDDSNDECEAYIEQKVLFGTRIVRPERLFAQTPEISGQNHLQKKLWITGKHGYILNRQPRSALRIKD